MVPDRNKSTSHRLEEDQRSLSSYFGDSELIKVWHVIFALTVQLLGDNNKHFIHSITSIPYLVIDNKEILSIQLSQLHINFS